MKATSDVQNNDCQDNFDKICEDGNFEQNERSFVCLLDFINYCFIGKPGCLELNIIINGVEKNWPEKSEFRRIENCSWNSKEIKEILLYKWEFSWNKYFHKG